MTVKFEMEVDEETFDSIIDSFALSDPVDLGDIFQGRKGVIQEISKHRDRIYGGGGMPVGVKTSGGEIKMIVI